MAGNRESSRRQSTRMAFCGLIVGLSVALMLTGGLIPIATYCAPMLCGVLLLPILLEFGKKAAWIAFCATAMISLMLGIDKEAAFFYLFIGYYPILKWEIDKIKKAPLRIAAKLGIFTVSIAIMYCILGFVLHMEVLVEEFSQMGALFLAIFVVMMNVCMMLYDRLIIPLSVLYVKRLRPRLKFLLK